jgi:dissimilatory sulfite reductase (desulfoviridin) alpha/beta subunit
VGTHNLSGIERWEVKISEKQVVFEDVCVDTKILECFKKQYDLRLKTRVGYILKKYGGYKFAKKVLKVVSK